MKELLMIIGLLAPRLVPFQVVPAGVTVSGQVIGPSSQNLTQTLRATLMGTTTQNTSINPDGSFKFSNVPPGTYTLTVNPAVLAQPISMVVGDKDITGIEAVVVPTAVVTGTVLVDGGGPRPRIFLSFSAFKGGVPASPATTLPDGTFRVVLREDEYQPAWSNLPAGYQLESITAGSLDLLKNTLKITGDTSLPPIVLRVSVDSTSSWVKVSGRISGLSRGQIQGKRLTLSSGPFLDPQDTALNADGSFEYPRVLPGVYTARLTPAIPVPDTTIIVPNGKDLSGVDITLPALRELTGRLVVEGLSQIAPRLTFILSDSSGPASRLGNLSSAGVAQSDGTFKVILPESEHKVSLSVPGFSVRSLTYGSTDLLRDPLKISSAVSQELHVTVVPLPNAVPPSSGVVLGGVLSGVLGGVAIGSPNTPVPPLPSPPPPSAQTGRTRVGGNIAAGNLISQVTPNYPAVAKEAGIQGVVVLEAEISKQGAVENLSVISGHPLLIQAAIDAVKQWRYRPVLVNNEAVPVVTTVTVNFAISRE